MALQLTASGLRKEVARLGKTPVSDLVPLAITSGASFATAGFLRQMKPGGLKTLASLAAFGGGGFFVVKSREHFSKAIWMGVAGGGLLTLIMRT